MAKGGFDISGRGGKGLEEAAEGESRSPFHKNILRRGRGETSETEQPSVSRS